MSNSAGARFRQALKEEQPLQIIGTIIANHALMAKHVGFRAIYLSGGGVAAGCGLLARAAVALESRASPPWRRPLAVGTAPAHQFVDLMVT